MAQNVPRLFVSLYTDEDVTSDLASALRRRVQCAGRGGSGQRRTF
jgi:hypothetical protein